MSTLKVNSIIPESGDVVTVNGVNIPGDLAVAGRILGPPTIVDTAGPYTIQHPDCTQLHVIVVGAGGSGSCDYWGPGAGGGTVYGWFTLTGQSQIQCIIGLGGPGVSSGAGNAGGTSTFETFIAGGGPGHPASKVNCAGGTASGGYLNIPGEIGEYQYERGVGGRSQFGNGGGYSIYGQPTATGYGGGGGAPHANATPGGNGSSGVIIITEYS